MEYQIKVDDALNEILTSNAKRQGMTVAELIASLLSQYVIDAHIMEKSELWEDGLRECAELELDWANL